MEKVAEHFAAGIDAWAREVESSGQPEGDPNCALVCAAVAFVCTHQPENCEKAIEDAAIIGCTCSGSGS